MAQARSHARFSAMEFLLAFVAGFLATLIFHQLALAGLNSAGLTTATLWVMTPVAPFGVPRIVSLAFFAGLFGLAYPFLRAWSPGLLGFLIAGALFGAIVPTLVSWYGVNALRGAALGPRGGWMLPGVLIGPIVNGAWGFGTALLLSVFHHRSGRPGI